MKTCANCGQPINDDAAFCNNCGTKVVIREVQGGQQQGAQQNYSQNQNNYQYQQQQQYQYQQPQQPEWFDHTAEFDAKQISEGKVWAMLAYLSGLVGIAIALLASISGRSDYINFHVRQAIKFSVISILSTICMVVLSWTVVVPIAGVIWMIVLWVVRIIAFFQVCAGKSKEPVIIRSFPFLK